MLCDCRCEIRPFTLRDGLKDRLLEVAANPSGHHDLDRPVIELVHRHPASPERLQRGGDLRGAGERVPERRRSFFAAVNRSPRLAESQFRRLDALVRLVLLEPHGHQLVREGLRRRPEGGLGHEGIRPVEVGEPPPLGVGHPQHAAEKLLHVHRTLNSGDGTEDVGEGAVPPLLEGFDGDHVLDSASSVEEINAIQFPLVTGRDRDPFRCDAFHLNQICLQRIDRHLLIPRLSLEEDQWTDVVGVAARTFRERSASRDGAAHRSLPGIVFGELDRQLDHRLGLELPGRDAVQDVVEPAAFPVAGGGGELDDRARVHPCLHLPGEAGHRIVRLVHDHQRAVHVK